MPASPTVSRRLLGAELRALREERGLTADEAAGRLGWHPSKMSRVETGRSGLRDAELSRVLDVYEVTEPVAREALSSMSRDGKRRKWWQPYSDVLTKRYSSFISLESEASSARSFQMSLVPGLLQTPDYARAVIRALKPERAPDEVNALVEVRLARQNAALNRESPLRVWGVIDEAVLHRVVGDGGLMAGQLKRLLTASEQPEITLQVLPFGAGSHAGLLGPFVILEFPVRADLDVVCTEGLTSNVYLEREEDVAAYSRAFDHVRAAALDVGPSRDLIARRAEDFT
ncbi:helix-turn-helix domain-containing protein [Streptomyces armeniacus]|uniref:Helix-turn-helix domain-containing protein n=1 Tax=Streptomyces armeniacus TaxID=83291 RepID=A0A345XMJ2_9ACTN|nr:helix-turn-helix transcriptional regulator [Streptomyces armeniacus]AXK32858.1 helix-turn-helix domain-containing protein [Streptomyces armeniacus]